MIKFLQGDTEQTYTEEGWYIVGVKPDRYGNLFFNLPMLIMTLTKGTQTFHKFIIC